jgi:hypothetical protein
MIYFYIFNFCFYASAAILARYPIYLLYVAYVFIKKDLLKREKVMRHALYNLSNILIRDLFILVSIVSVKNANSLLTPLSGAVFAYFLFKSKKDIKSIELKYFKPFYFFILKITISVFVINTLCATTDNFSANKIQWHFLVIWHNSKYLLPTIFIFLLLSISKNIKYSTKAYIIIFLPNLLIAILKMISKLYLTNIINSLSVT